MNATQSPSYLHQFSWEEWDNQMIAVIYRSDRRFVVKRYIERVLTNSPLWQQLTQSSAFFSVQPIDQAQPMTENDVKLMHRIFSWHLNGTLTFPIIAGLDQLLDWEDVLDFIQRVQLASKTDKRSNSVSLTSPAIFPSIPVGVLSSTIPLKRTVEKTQNSENIPPNKGSTTPIRITRQQQPVSTATTLFSSSSNYWVQIDYICVPYIVKPQQIRLLPYQVLLDCDLLNEQEQAFLLHLTIKATSDDIRSLESIISSSSSISFTLNNDLLLINLYHLIFGMSKIVYIKLLPNQRDVNKSYKSVLAQSGGTVNFRSLSIPFISLGKIDYILLDSLIAVLQPTAKAISALRRRTLSAQVHEVDYLRLVEFFHQKYQHDDNTVPNQQQSLLINIQEIHKSVNEKDFTVDMSLTQYQQSEYQKLRKQVDVTGNKPVRKPTKRKLGTAIAERQNTTPVDQ